MNHQTIPAEHLKQICWMNDQIADFASGNIYSLNGSSKQLGSAMRFGDTSICSEDGIYAFIYDKLGTKGLLLRNGEELREINRSFYCSDVYEYPAAFACIDGITYLIHCPDEYNRLEFENVETGAIVTKRSDREPEDNFHSRLIISPDGKYLMSRGWVWHPLDKVQTYDINACIKDPKQLDAPKYELNVLGEFCTADFIDNDTILVGSSADETDMEDDEFRFPAGHIAKYSFKTGDLSAPVKPDEPMGNLFVINEKYAWDMYKYPKVIEISTGCVIDKNETIFSGEQASAIIGSLNDKYVSVAFNRSTKQMAIKGQEKIHVLTPEL